MLSALLLTPAASAQVVSTTPSAVQATTVSLPAPMTNVELDEVSGEWGAVVVRAATEAVKACTRSAACGAAAGYVGAKADKIVDAAVERVSSWIKGD